MSEDVEVSGTASAFREVNAPAGVIFDLIADLSQQPRWMGTTTWRSSWVAESVGGCGTTRWLVSVPSPAAL